MSKVGVTQKGFFDSFDYIMFILFLGQAVGILFFQLLQNYFIPSAVVKQIALDNTKLFTIALLIMVPI